MGTVDASKLQTMRVENLEEPDRTGTVPDDQTGMAEPGRRGSGGRRGEGLSRQGQVLGVSGLQTMQVGPSGTQIDRSGVPPRTKRKKPFSRGDPTVMPVEIYLGGATGEEGAAMAAPPPQPTKAKRKKPYGKRTWEEQKEAMDLEEKRAKDDDERERFRLQRLAPKEEKVKKNLVNYRPRAPRNTTQFLIDSREDDEISTGEDSVGIDEHGSMMDQSFEFLKLRSEIHRSANKISPQVRDEDMSVALLVTGVGDS